MAKFRKTHNRFTSGEVSKRLRGSYDLEEYQSACFQMENFLGSKSGGAYQRAGTIYTGANIFASGTFNLTDINDNYYMFRIDDTHSGVIRFGTSNANILLSILKNGNTLHATITGTHYNGVAPWITSFTVLPYARGTLRARDFHMTRVGDVYIFTHTSGEMMPYMLVLNSSTKYIEYFGPYTHMDSIFMDSLASNYAAFKVPYEPQNVSSETRIKVINADVAVPATTTITSATALTVEILLSMVNSGGSLITYWYDANDENGTIIELISGSNILWVYVKSVDEANKEITVTVCHCIGTFTEGDIITQWRRSAWGGSRGYPKTSFVAASRLGFANCPYHPLRMWMSVEDNIYIMMDARVSVSYTAATYLPAYHSSAASTDAMSYDITGTTSSSIRWVYPGKNLEVGTDAEEFTYAGFDATGSKGVTLQSSAGSSYVQPVRVGNSTIFVGNDSKSLIMMSYSDEAGANLLTNMTVLNENILDYYDSDGVESDNFNLDGIYKIVYSSLHGHIFLLTKGGLLYSLLIDANNKPVGWQRHTFTFPTGGTSDKIYEIVLSDVVTSVGNTGGTMTMGSPTLLMIKGKLDGTWSFNIEALASSATLNTLNFWNNSMLNQYLDSYAVAYSATPKSTWAYSDFHIAGHPKLADQTVSVIADGNYLGEYTYSSSSGITLSANYSYVVIGLIYTAILEPVSPVLPSQSGSHLEAWRRIDRVEVDFYRSKACSVGTPNSDMREVPFESNATLETKKYIQPLSSNSEQDQTVLLKNTKPVPCNILSITYRGVLAE